MGKSSVINSLLRSKATPTGDRPGITKCLQTVQLDKVLPTPSRAPPPDPPREPPPTARRAQGITLIDSPGVVVDPSASAIDLALRRCVAVDKACPRPALLHPPFRTLAPLAPRQPPRRLRPPPEAACRASGRVPQRRARGASRAAQGLTRRTPRSTIPRAQRVRSSGGTARPAPAPKRARDTPHRPCFYTRWLGKRTPRCRAAPLSSVFRAVWKTLRRPRPLCARARGRCGAHAVRTVFGIGAGAGGGDGGGALLAAVAHKRGKLLRGGEPDVEAAARAVLRRAPLPLPPLPASPSLSLSPHPWPPPALGERGRRVSARGVSARRGQGVERGDAAALPAAPEAGARRDGRGLCRRGLLPRLRAGARAPRVVRPRSAHAGRRARGRGKSAFLCPTQSLYPRRLRCVPRTPAEPDGLRARPCPCSPCPRAAAPCPYRRCPRSPSPWPS